MASQTDIVNRSLLGIGARAQVSSFSEGSTESNAAAVLFTPTFEALARAAHWNCLRKQAVLSIVQAAKGTAENPMGTSLPVPPTPWLYAYALPPDSLQVRFIVPSLPSSGLPTFTTYQNGAPSWVPGGGEIPFTVAYGTDLTGNPVQFILTNQDQAQAVYTVNQPNPIIWDSQFQAAMVASLGAYLVPALSLNMPLMNMQIKLAQEIIDRARARDGNEGTQTQDHLPDWMRARGGESRYYGWGGWYGQGGWGDMPWPGG